MLTISSWRPAGLSSCPLAEGSAHERQAAAYLEEHISPKEHGGIEYAWRTMDVLRAKALDLLEGVPAGEVKEALTAYIDYVVERDK